ncbi:MAG TPA: NAD(P)-dependent oxidoreductase [Bacteroidia bacterium]|nr:NAD(P)-dependent oxidoreductase [Bacteroidia bacterium]
MKHAVLFIDSVHQALSDQLEKNGFDCIDGTSWDLEKIYDQLPHFYGIVIRSRFKINKEFLKRPHQLKFIARAGSGMENIDVEFATSQNITCINAPEANKDAVAEQAIGMLLMLMNKLAIADKEVRTGMWKRGENRGWELNGSTVSIIGFGNNGSAFAKKLSGFDVSIQTYDPFVTVNSKLFPYVNQVDMQTIFDKTDIISFHVPLNKDTDYMVNENYLSSFKKNIWLINTARGKILKTEALVKGLESGKVRGAALDVLEYESTSFEQLDASQLPESFKYLIRSDKTVLSPHIAGWTHESHRKISVVLAEKILKLV